MFHPPISRMNLASKCPSAFFTEKQQEVILEELMDMMPGKSARNLDVVMKVLLPEIMIKIYQGIRNIPYEEAEQELLEGEVPEAEEPVEEVFI